MHGRPPHCSGSMLASVDGGPSIDRNLNQRESETLFGSFCSLINTWRVPVCNLAVPALIHCNTITFRQFRVPEGSKTTIRPCFFPDKQGRGGETSSPKT